MIKNVRTSGYHRVDGSVAIQKIGCEHLNNNAWIRRANGFNGSAKMLCSSVRKIISRHGGNDHMTKPHAPCCLGDAGWLICFERQRLGRGYRAKTTCPRATVTSNHERGGPLSQTVCSFNSSNKLRVWAKVSEVGSLIRSHSGRRSRGFKSMVFDSTILRLPFFAKDRP